MKWIEEIGRDQSVVLWLDHLVQDVGYGTRLLRRNPAFTVLVVLTLALGIGANTALFSVVSAVLLRPLPYPNPEQLVQVRKDFRWEWQEKNELTDWLDVADIRAFKKDAAAVVEVAGYAWGQLNLSGGGEAERVSCGAVSDSFLPILGRRVLIGRNFLPEEDRPGGPAVAILSYGLWAHHFGADSGVLGQTIRLDEKPHTVVGVLSSTFQFPAQYDVLVPLALHPEGWREGQFLSSVLGRLKPGVSPERARTLLDDLYRALPHPRQSGHIVLAGFQEHQVQNARHNLLVFLGAAGFVLLIACTNVANLLLSRAASRQKEIAVRAALGAGRGRIIRQLLVESLLLALLAGVLGILLAAWGCQLLRPVVASLPAVRPVRIDAWVLGYTLMASVVTGLLFGLGPAWVISRPRLSEGLKEGSQSTTGGPRHHRLQGTLVVAEVALAMVLLLGAGLLARSFLRLMGVDPGFRPDRILSLSIKLSQPKYPDAHSQVAYHEEVLRRLRSLPGVEAVGANATLPMGYFGMSTTISIEGRPESAGPPPFASLGIVNEDYFRALGIPLRRGRGFSEQDRKGAPSVAVINESFARRFFPDEEPLGKRIGGPEDWRTIVGVVGDVKNSGLDREATPELFVPYQQAECSHMSLAIRTKGDPMKVAGEVRRRVMSVDKDQPIFGLMTMEQRLSNTLAPRRVTTCLLGAFALLAVLLAAVGIYGVISYSVSQRTHEIGIRMALGGNKRHILQLVIQHGLWTTGMGLFLGAAGGVALTRLVSNQLFGVSPLDPITFAGVILLLAAVALAACFVPARRATSVDPLVALRYE